MKLQKQIIIIMTIVFAINTNAQSRVDDRILRDPQPKDFANVYWEAPYTLFDLLTDEPIFPAFEKCRKIYKIYYSSNENPQIFYDEFTIEQLQNHLFYKFKTSENCQKWCDNKNSEK